MAGKGDIALPDFDFPEDDCGYVVLAMGKHGARELNYSSDVDLVVLYDPIRLDYRGDRAEQQALDRMTRDLVKILSERTADGYVARVDFRLRPDPSVTPIAVPYAAALSYYLGRGRDWERAAMIKARPVAGDLTLGWQFLSEISPFIWRDERDFWTLRAIQSIKQQIDKQRGGNKIGFEGQNIKLGRGGIREVEFFAQALQLIFGGRDPYVRSIKTVDALAALSEAGWVELEVAEDLIHGYEFLRSVEHRLQMVNDEQTQTLPSDEAALNEIAAFMAYDETEDFRTALRDHMHKIDEHYSDVFEKTTEAVELSSDLLEQKIDQVSEHLSAAGFRDGASALAVVRSWIESAQPVSEDQRAPALVKRLAPALLETIAKGTAPDDALRQFDWLLRSVEYPVRFLSLLDANPVLSELIAHLVGNAPALVRELASMPVLLETALGRDSLRKSWSRDC